MIEAFAHVPAYPLVFPLFWGAAVVFGLVMARHLRVLAAVHGAGPSPFGRLPERTWSLIRYAIVQTRMFRDPVPGLMHAGIFWGFVVLTIVTADIVTGGIVRAVISWPFDGLLWTILSALQSAVALAVLAAIGVAFYRRLIVRPARLTYTLDALVILALIGGVVASEVLAQAFEAAAYGEIPGAWLANALADPIGGLRSGTAEVGFVVFWWSHITLVAAFLVYLPFSKHLHIATSFLNVFFRKLEPRGRLPMLDLEREDATFGVRTIGDLSWKDLLDGFTCTECGRCQAACPANATGKPLDPKAFIMGLRDMAVDAEHGVDLIPNSPLVRQTYGLDDTRLDAAALGQPIVGAAIPYDAVWDCVTCGACVEACPVLMDYGGMVVGLRRNLVLEDSRFPAELTAAFRNLEGPGNPWGQPPGARLDWTKGLPFSVPTLAEVASQGRLDDLEVIYWVGCAAAFDERNKKVARAVTSCLHAAGVAFAVLGQEESCTGDPARRMGNEYVFQLLAAANVETLNRYRAGERTIVTACPHCFNSLGVEYVQMGGRFRVEHHSVYLGRLLADGRLQTVPADGGGGEGSRSVTFHDPCYLARYNGLVAAPRDLLAAAPGVEMREMERNGRNSFCCGAGGGRMWMEEQRGTRINHERTRQALETGASVVATGCPFCMTMLKDGLDDAGASTRAADPVVAMDIAEILAGSLAPAATDGRRALPVVH